MLALRQPESSLGYVLALVARQKEFVSISNCFWKCEVSDDPVEVTLDLQTRVSWLQEVIDELLSLSSDLIILFANCLLVINIGIIDQWQGIVDIGPELRPSSLHVVHETLFRTNPTESMRS